MGDFENLGSGGNPQYVASGGDGASGIVCGEVFARDSEGVCFIRRRCDISCFRDHLGLVFSHQQGFVDEFLCTRGGGMGSVVARRFAGDGSFGDYRGSLLEAGFDLRNEPDARVFLLGNHPAGFRNDKNR